MRTRKRGDFTRLRKVSTERRGPPVQSWSSDPTYLLVSIAINPYSDGWSAPLLNGRRQLCVHPLLSGNVLGPLDIFLCLLQRQ